MKVPFDSKQTQSHTQALWRFLQNDKINLAALAKPILDNAIAGANQHCQDWILVMHDWSMLHLPHANKADRLQKSHQYDIGYELQSSLLVSDTTGLPIAPVAQNLVTAEGTLSSYTGKMMPTQSHLDELAQRINWLGEQNFKLPLLHIVDREADSALHMRQWAQAGHHFLVRVNATNTLTYQGVSQKCAQIAEQISYQKQPQPIQYKGKKAYLSIATTPVVLTRKAKPKAQENGKRKAPITGEPLALNLICTKIQDKQGHVLAQWFLLSNTNYAIEKLVHFYYLRWQIESYFKLLKGAGFHMEEWLQETGLAFFKRALIVAQSCVLVWHLMHDLSPEAMKYKRFLVRLSGKNTKRHRTITAPAVLAGYLALLSAHELLQQMSPEEIAQSVRLFQRGFV